MKEVDNSQKSYEYHFVIHPKESIKYKGLHFFTLIYYVLHFLILRKDNLKEDRIEMDCKVKVYIPWRQGYKG